MSPNCTACPSLFAGGKIDLLPPGGCGPSPYVGNNVCLTGVVGDGGVQDEICCGCSGYGEKPNTPWVCSLRAVDNTP